MVATAAIREATNTKDVDARSPRRPDVEVDVLSEEEEGRLAFIGATKTLGHPVEGDDRRRRRRRWLVGDHPRHGGRRRARGRVRSRSAPGSLAEDFLTNDPPSAAEIRALRDDIADFFEDVEVDQPEQAVAVGGSATSLRTLVGAVLEYETLERGVRVLTGDPIAEVAKRFELDPRRVRILPGRACCSWRSSPSCSASRCRSARAVCARASSSTSSTAPPTAPRRLSRPSPGRLRPVGSGDGEGPADRGIGADEPLAARPRPRSSRCAPASCRPLARACSTLAEIERVHDMRVATRRLRAALEVFEPCFPGKAHAAVLRQVKALADALGERRDRDVTSPLWSSRGARGPRPPGVGAWSRRCGGSRSRRTRRSPVRDPGARCSAVRASLRARGRGRDGRGRSPAAPQSRSGSPRPRPRRRGSRDNGGGGRNEGQAGQEARPRGAAGGERRPDRARPPDELRSFGPPALDPERAAEPARPAHRRQAPALRARGDRLLLRRRAGPVARRRARDLQDVLGELHDCDVMLPRVERTSRALRELDADAVRERAGEAQDLDPALARERPTAPPIAASRCWRSTVAGPPQAALRPLRRALGRARAAWRLGAPRARRRPGPAPGSGAPARPPSAPTRRSASSRAAEREEREAAERAAPARRARAGPEARDAPPAARDPERDAVAQVGSAGGGSRLRCRGASAACPPRRPGSAYAGAAGSATPSSIRPETVAMTSTTTTLELRYDPAHNRFLGGTTPRFTEPRSCSGLSRFNLDYLGPKISSVKVNGVAPPSSATERSSSSRPRRASPTASAVRRRGQLQAASRRRSPTPTARRRAGCAPTTGRSWSASRRAPRPGSRATTTRPTRRPTTSPSRSQGASRRSRTARSQLETTPGTGRPGQLDRRRADGHLPRDRHGREVRHRGAHRSSPASARRRLRSRASVRPATGPCTRAPRSSTSSAASSAPTRSRQPARSSTSADIGYALETQTRPVYRRRARRRPRRPRAGPSVVRRRRLLSGWSQIWLNEGFAT